MTAPGVQVNLIDQSSYIPSGASVYGGIVGAFKKGPLVPTLCTSQSQFLRWFAPDEKPKTGYDQAYYSALDYLADADALWVVRAVSGTTAPLYGGVTVVASTSESSSTPWSTGKANPEGMEFETGEVMAIYGANQGLWNNDIFIEIVTDATKVGLTGAFLINIYKAIAGTQEFNQVESHLVSRDPDMVDGYGNNIYLENVINGNSNYIAVNNNELVAKTVMPKAIAKPTYVSNVLTATALGGGTDGDAVTAADKITALEKLGNPEELSLQLLMNGGDSTATYQKAMLSLCETNRKHETFAILTTPADKEKLQDAVTQLVNYRKTDLNANSYMGSIYTPHVKYYDRFNDRYFFASPDGMVANKINATIRDYGYNFPAAGYTRGQLGTALDVQKKFLPGELNSLCDNQINAIKNDPGRGVVIFDNQTLYTTKSDLQDQNNMICINLQIRPGLREFLKDYLFELNDEITRGIIVAKIDLFMKDVKAQRGVSDYLIVCDNTNNSPNDVQAGILNIDLYVKMVKGIKFIKQSIIATSQGLDFSQLAA